MAVEPVVRLVISEDIGRHIIAFFGKVAELLELVPEWHKYDTDRIVAEMEDIAGKMLVLRAEHQLVTQDSQGDGE